MNGQKKKRIILEQDLFPPLSAYLEENGYTVRAEVKDCDITATKGDDLLVIEMKRTCSIDLLIQATARQRLSDSVYVAIPAPVKGLRDRHWRGVQHLLKRLELGLIFVYLGGIAPRVDVLFHPLPCLRQKRKSSRCAVLTEMAGRSGNHNVGGVSGKKLVTAYRERAIHIACALACHGEMSPRALRALDPSPGEKTHSILYSNVYGWFSRVGRGLYALTPAGRNALQEYERIAAVYLKHFASSSSEPLTSSLPAGISSGVQRPAKKKR